MTRFGDDSYSGNKSGRFSLIVAARLHEEKGNRMSR